MKFDRILASVLATFCSGEAGNDIYEDESEEMR